VRILSCTKPLLQNCSPNRRQKEDASDYVIHFLPWCFFTSATAYPFPAMCRTNLLSVAVLFDTANNASK